MNKWVCSICGYIYDEAREELRFEQLPESWVCPICGAPKSAFSPEKKAQDKPAPPPPLPEEEYRLLSAGELAAVCSNLARGCEKQYLQRQSELFLQLADFFTAAAPEEPGDLDTLIELIRRDLEQGYPSLQSAARQQGDRGTQRICVWGEKVTRMLESLLSRYRSEGEAFLQNTRVWVCTVCGFVYVGDAPPQLCPVCKVPAWKFEQVEGRR